MVAIEVPGGGWVDHVVLGVSDVDAGVKHVRDLTGIEPRAAAVPPLPSSPTTSRSISLGGQRFLEIYAPNPAYTGPEHAMRGVLAGLDRPRLLTWFARVEDLDAAADALAASGRSELSPFLDERGRTTAPAFRNGHLVDDLFNPSIPFLIQWIDRMDMDDRMATGADLVELRVTARDPHRTRALHRVLGIEVPVDGGRRDRVSIRLATPAGEVTID